MTGELDTTPNGQELVRTSFVTEIVFWFLSVKFLEPNPSKHWMTTWFPACNKLWTCPVQRGKRFSSMIVWKIFDGTSLLRSGWARQNWSLSCLNGLTKCLCWKNKVLSHDLLFPLSAVRGLRGFVTGLIAWENFYVLHRSSGVALRRHRHFEHWTTQLLTMPNSDFSCGRNTFFSEAAIAQRFSFRKYPKSAQT